MHNLVGEKIEELLDRHDKSVSELARQTGTAPWAWQKLIKGRIRLNVDLAIRLGKVFPNGKHSDEDYIYWLFLQYKSDIQNASDEDGPMYRDIKPF